MSLLSLSKMFFYVIFSRIFDLPKPGKSIGFLSLFWKSKQMDIHTIHPRLFVFPEERKYEEEVNLLVVLLPSHPNP
jgi:hypothetical protein